MADVQLDYTAAQIDNTLERLVEIGFIHAYIDTPHNQDIAGTPEVLEAPLLDDQCCFTISTGRLTYTGVPARTFLGVASFSMQTSTPDTTVTIKLYKNGIEVPGTTLSRKMSTAGDVGAVTGNAVIVLNQSDYLEIYVNADKSTTLTLNNFQFSILGV